MLTQIVHRLGKRNGFGTKLRLDRIGRDGADRGARQPHPETQPSNCFIKDLALGSAAFV